jgi:hypothetical protein
MKLRYLLIALVLVLLILPNLFFVSADDTFEPMSPNEIWYIDDLYAIRYNLSADYILMRSLDFENNGHYVNYSASKTENTTGTGWLPIGSYAATSFTGYFEGQGYSISNLFIDRPSTLDEVGLFGCCEDAEISNLSLYEVDVTGRASVGSLAGYIDTCLVYNCSAYPQERAVLTGTVNQVGGLIGTAFDSIIENCSSSIDVYFDNSLYPTQGISFGGLIGLAQYVVANNIIKNCFATGNVTTHYSAGGLIGSAYGYGSILNCYATGITTTDVTGSYGGCGGLIGNSQSMVIKDCYATGSVTSQTMAGGFVAESDYDEFYSCYSTGNVQGVNYVGGFVGDFYGLDVPDAKIINCYSTGSVTRASGTSSYVGGFCGRNRNSIIHYSYCKGLVTCGSDTNKGFCGAVSTGYAYSDVGNFFDNQTTGQTSTAGNAIGKYTSAMKSFSTFDDADWDIVLYDEWYNNMWFINNTAYYPRIWWEEFEWLPLLNSPPNYPTNITPSNGSYVDVYVSLNVTVIDDDNDSMNVSFYWSNDTLIETVTNISNNSVASINFTDDWLQHNTTYYWYVNISDGQASIESAIYNFTTCVAWDLYPDKSIDAIDVSILVTYYAYTCIPGSEPWDIHPDGVCNALDVSILVTYYGTSY